MDTRTGEIYGSFEAAREAGVPEQFLAPVPRHAIDTRRECQKPRDAERSKHQPHQGDRERARRQRQKAA